MGRRGPQQDAEKVRQHRSRIVQILNVPQRVRLRSSLAAALLDSLFEHPAGMFSRCATLADHRGSSGATIVFSQPARVDTGSRDTAAPGHFLVSERDRRGTATRAEKIFGERLDDGRVIALAAENVEIGIVRIVSKMAADQRGRDQLHHGIAGHAA